MEPAASKRDNTTPSCAVCQRRKVKCNRVFPCAPCQKTGLECEFRAVTRHRTKKLKRTHSPSGEDATEISPNDILAGSGSQAYNDISTRTSNHSSPVATIGGEDTPARSHDTPEYRTGPSIYESVVQQGSEIAGHESPPRRNFLFGAASSDPTPRASTSVNASPSQTVQLWQTYLANVDPIMKVCHAPTVQQLVLGSIGKPHIPRNEQALLSAIYLVSTVSLWDDECEALLQQTRNSLISGFQRGTEDALSAAGFVTAADIMVLQALILYLAALRSLGEMNLVWSLLGVAIRVAGTMGLAQDCELLGLPPFECETRRRLWWTMLDLNAVTAELVGQDHHLLGQNGDTKPPSNLNDSDLFLGMRRIPEPRAAASDTVYVRARASIASQWLAITRTNGLRITQSADAYPKEVKTLDTLAKCLADEILDYCDPSVPLQRLAINSAQTSLAKLRLGNILSAPLETDEHDSADGFSKDRFEVSLRIMELQLELWTEPSLQKWRWHSQGQFAWHALADITKQLRIQPTWHEAGKAWEVIRGVFENIIPYLQLGSKNPELDHLRALVKAAMDKHKRNSKGGGQASSVVAAAYTPAKAWKYGGASVNIARPDYGSRPFSALLPGLSDSYPASAGNPPGRTSRSESREDGLDELGAMDWEEFDRLVSYMFPRT